MSDEQKQKIKDYQKNIEKIKKYQNNKNRGRFYYLIKHVATKSSAKQVDRLL